MGTFSKQIILIKNIDSINTMETRGVGARRVKRTVTRCLPDVYTMDFNQLNTVTRQGEVTMLYCGGWTDFSVMNSMFAIL